MARREVRRKTSTELGSEREEIRDTTVGGTQVAPREGFPKRPNAGGQEPVEKVKFR